MRVRKMDIDELDTLMEWRMEVLHEVFSIPSGTDMSALEQANRDYYLQEIPGGGHVACIAEPAIGCGGLCLYSEMPSPDNPTGRCAYLMNIYVRAEFRGNGYGKEIVNWLIHYARQLGITKVFLETSDSGRRLYTDVGFKYMPDMMKLM